MIRNLATMTRVGLLAPGSDARRTVVDAAGRRRAAAEGARPPDRGARGAEDLRRRARRARQARPGRRSPQVVDALDGAFYAAFGNVPATGKRWLLALDVSGSMDGGAIAGVPGLTPRVASARDGARHGGDRSATTRIVGFTSRAGRLRRQWGGGDPGLTPLSISPRQRLDDVAEARWRPADGRHRLRAADAAGRMKQQAGRPTSSWSTPTARPGRATSTRRRRCGEYRERSAPAAKLVVVGMVSNGFTIADPNDAGMLDVVGFDTAAPAAHRRLRHRWHHRARSGRG